MKQIVITLLFAALPLYADTPGTVKFPGALDSSVSLFEATDNATTTLTLAANSSDATLTVASTATFPSSGAITIENEIIYYTGKSSTTFTGCIRGSAGTTAASHSSGRSVQGRFTAAHHNVVRDSLIAAQAKVGAGSSTPADGFFLVGDGSGTSAWRLILASDVPTLAPSKITGTAVVTSDTRLSDARTPTSHATTHAAAGFDPVTLTEAQITNLSADLGSKLGLHATADTATVLATPRAINGVDFDGSAPITVPAAAGTLTGSTLNSTVTVSSLSSVATGAITDTMASLAVKPSCGLVAASNITLSGAQTIDGVAGTAGTTIVLATAQTSGAENGPWVMQSGAWTRPTWYPSGGTTQAFQFITTFIRLGNTYSGTTWRITSSGAVTIDTTATTWAQAVNGTALAPASLAANGTNCSAGNYALGVDASGNAEGCTAVAVAPFSDATAIVKNASDTTKQFKVDASAITTGNTVTMTPPVASGSYTAARKDAAQTFVGVQTFDSSTAPVLQFGNSSTGIHGNTSFNFIAFTVSSSARLSVSSTGIAIGNGGCYGVASSSGATGASPDTGLCRTAAGIWSAGNGSVGDTSGTVRAAHQEVVVGSSVASASTITPTSGLFHVTGTTQITTINLPRTGYTGCLRLIPDGAFATATGGNIALASTAVVSRVLEMCYDGTSWYPSY